MKLNFDEAFNKRILEAFKYNDNIKKFIDKKLNGRIAAIHPYFLDDILLFATQKQESYRLDTLETFLDIFNIYVSVKGTHREFDGIPISQNYIEKSSRHFNTTQKFQDIFNIFFELEHKGNNMDGFGCSSYNRKHEDIFDELQENIAYIKSQEMYKYLKDFLEGNISKDDYITIYSNLVRSKTNKKLQQLKPKIDFVNEIKKEEKQAKLSTKTFRELGKFEIIEEEFNFLIGSLKEKENLVKKVSSTFIEMSYRKQIKSIKQVLNSIIEVQDKKYIAFDNSISITNGREFNILSGMNKTIRKELLDISFDKIDISNMAFSSISHKLNIGEEFTYFRAYVSYRDKFLNVLTSNVIGNAIVSQSRRLEIKGYIKQTLLSILFGSNLYDGNYKLLKSAKAKGILYTNKEETLILIGSLLRTSEAIKQLIHEVHIIAKNNNLEKKDLSHIFMTIETEVMNGLDTIFKNNFIPTKNSPFYRSLRIHDEINIARGLYNEGTHNMAISYLSEYGLRSKDLNALAIGNSSEDMEIIENSIENSIEKKKIEDEIARLYESLDIVKIKRRNSRLDYKGLMKSIDDYGDSIVSIKDIRKGKNLGYLFKDEVMEGLWALAKAKESGIEVNVTNQGSSEIEEVCSPLLASQSTDTVVSDSGFAFNRYHNMLFFYFLFLIFGFFSFQKSSDIHMPLSLVINIYLIFVFERYFFENYRFT